MKNIVACWIFAAAVIFLACSTYSDNPVLPSFQADGQLAIINVGSEPLIISECCQSRGTENVSKCLNVWIMPQRTFVIPNILEPSGGTRFHGGDMINIRICSAACLPDNPGEPKFEWRYEVVVRGSKTLAVAGSDVKLPYPE